MLGKEPSKTLYLANTQRGAKDDKQSIITKIKAWSPFLIKHEL